MSSNNQKFLAKPVNSFYILAISALSLSVIGLIMVFSASSIHALDTRGSAVAIVLRQLTFFVISIPLAICAKAVVLIKIKRVPIETRPISPESSVDLNNLKAKNTKMTGTKLANMPTPPNRNEYVDRPTKLLRSNQTPAAETKARMKRKNATPSLW